MAVAVESSVLRTGVKEFSVKALFSRFAQKAAGWSMFNWLFNGRMPTTLLYTPFDMHLADPNLAHEFYHGRFPLAGRVVQVGADSPFLIEPPTQEWEDELHSFGWLNHMMAAETELADAHARSLTRDWMNEIGNKPTGAPWAPIIAARRLSAWMAHSDMLYKHGTASFQKQFLRQISLHIRFLRFACAGEINDTNRLLIASSLAMAALVVQAPSRKRAQRLQLQASRRLEAELSWQILPDGGHVSRNPAVLLELLTCLIPLQYAYMQRNVEPPRSLIVSIDRMLPALRFFRHRDGTLANFNGVGPVDPQSIDVVLDIDDAAQDPLSTHAPHSGYQRLSADETVVLADTGHSFSKKLTETANAGCLSFEMSSGHQRFIVNCGITPYGSADFRFFGRLTAAHSTAIIDDTSSCRFVVSDNPESAFIGPALEVKVDRIAEDDAHGFIASHDGYKKPFNLIHERTLSLSDDGQVLTGNDNFYKATDKAGIFSKQPITDESEQQITIRFHIHPDIIITHDKLIDEDTNQEIDVVLLTGQDKEAWIFSADCPVQLEDSIYFSGLSGPLKTQQLVLNFMRDDQQTVKWMFSRKLD